MTIKELIEIVTHSKELTPETIEEIEENDALRLELVHYFGNCKNRKFALDLLNLLGDARRNCKPPVSGDTLMLACYLLAKHKQIEDCLKIWETKRIDFDSYCYIDIQLVAFAGVQVTIDYLSHLTSDEAKHALEYIIACSNAGDFDNLEKYSNEIPWFV